MAVTEPGISLEELQLAARNHGMPLEALRWPVTPVGLHYLLIHYDIPAVDPASWRLELGGLVARPLSLSLEELRARPAVELAVTMECAGNGRAKLEPRPVSQPWLQEAVGTGTWRGAPLRALLDEAGVDERAVEVVFTGLDHGIEGEVEQDYARSLTITEAMRDEVLLAYDLNGAALPPQHGFPLRLVVPGWYGMTNVKWLARIELVDRPFEGYQQVSGYRMRADPEEPGEPVQRMAPRALMAPPGSPEFFTRVRTLRAGPTVLQGRAWAGRAPVERVEVSTDGGASWADAELGPAELGPWAWRGWTFAWQADPGQHVVCCRATDADGNAQPDEPPWNVGGYANNAVQRVSVEVVP
jgi:sulfane dehydrogenase subunit SoxC